MKNRNLIFMSFALMVFMFSVSDSLHGIFSTNFVQVFNLNAGT